MHTDKFKLTQKELKKVLVYDPDSGKFSWRIKTNVRNVVGSEAGSPRRNGTYIGLNCKQYPVAKLAWLYMTGKWPHNRIIHKDFDKCNDTWKNLVDASTYRGNPKKCQLIFEGVFLGHNYNYNVFLIVDGEVKFIGSSYNRDKAWQEYSKAKKHLEERKFEEKRHAKT